jgi:hypothetical protein
MVTDLRTACQRWVAFVTVTSLLGLSFSMGTARADNPIGGQAPEVGSGPVDMPSQRPGSPRARARKPAGKPGESGIFLNEIINTIRIQSAELCVRYGSPSDCLEEAEVCLTMRDNEDNQVRLCLNTTSRDSADGDGKVQKSRMRR